MLAWPSYILLPLDVSDSDLLTQYTASTKSDAVRIARERRNIGVGIAEPRPLSKEVDRVFVRK